MHRPELTVVVVFLFAEADIIAILQTHRGAGYRLAGFVENATGNCLGLFERQIELNPLARKKVAVGRSSQGHSRSRSDEKVLLPLPSKRTAGRLAEYLE